MTDLRDDETQFWERPEWATTGSTELVNRRADRTGPIERTRRHRVVERTSPPAPPPGAVTFDDFAPVDDVDPWGEVDQWVEPLDEPRRTALVGIDPGLVRVGAIAIAGVLAIPVALALRDDGDGDGLRAEEVAAVASTIAPAPLGAPATTVVTVPPPAAAAPAAVAAPAAAVSGQPARVAAAAAEPECAGTYTVIANDYWNRFPRSSGAGVDEWLAANGATPDTPLYVGDELCIPVGATAPSPPPPTTPPPPASTAAPTTQAPATTAAPVTTAAPPTTVAPVTTPAPAPTSPPTAPPARPVVTSGRSDPASVEAIIREVWPDELEERALAIAKRESGLRPDVHNWCCYGVFAIYFDMGRNFLPGLGVTSPDQLLDARTNVVAAYHLYTLSGWRPWAQTDPG